MRNWAILGIFTSMFGFGASAAPAPSPQDSDLPSRVAGLHSALTDSKGCYILCEFVDRETGSILAGDILVGHGKLDATGFERATRWMTVRYLPEAPLALEVKRPGLHVLEFISPNHARVQAVFKVDRVARRVWTARVKVWRGGGVRLKVLDPGGRPVCGASASLVRTPELSARIESLMKEAEKIFNAGLPRRPEGFLIAFPAFVESMNYGSNLPSVSDAEGNLLLQGHFEGEYRFTVWAPGFAAVRTEKIQVREGSIVTSEVRLGRAHRVVVEAVSAGGKGVEGLVVNFGEKERRLTDAAGLCRGALPPGDAVIEVRGFGYRSRKLEVKVRPGENRVRVAMKARSER